MVDAVEDGTAGLTPAKEETLPAAVDNFIQKYGKGTAPVDSFIEKYGKVPQENAAPKAAVVGKDATEDFIKKYAPKEKKTFFSEAFPDSAPDPGASPLSAGNMVGTDYFAQQKHEVAKAVRQVESGGDRLLHPTLLNVPLGALEVAGGAINYITAPIAALARSTLGTPLERATGVKGVADVVADGAALAVQFPTAIAKGLAAAGVDVFKGLSQKGIAEVAIAAGNRYATKLNNTELVGSIESVFSPSTKVAMRDTAAAAKQGKIIAEHEHAAAKMGSILTEGFARVAADSALSKTAMETSEKMVLAMSPAEKLQFMREVEPVWAGKSTFTNSYVSKMADILRGELKMRESKLLKMGLLKDALEVYFPHIWKNPEANKQLIDEVFASSTKSSKAPFLGSKNFQKQRTIDMIAQGLDRGLELATTNPLELTSIKLREMDRAIRGQEMKDKMISSGLAQIVKAGERLPAGMDYLQDYAFTAGRGARYAAPIHAARVFNNAMKGSMLHGGLFNAVRGFANAMNRAQLSIPGFHFLFMTKDSITSEVALALKAAVEGHYVDSLKHLSVAPYSVADKLWKGNLVKKAYLGSNAASASYLRTAENLKRAGGRIAMDKVYRVSHTGGYWHSFTKGYLKEEFLSHIKDAKLRAIYQVPVRVLETLSEPLMESFVPRIKMGVFRDMEQYYLKYHPNATEDEATFAFQQMWASVDNRMGEMVYDDVFMNQTLKDSLFMMVRSVGWNLGTERELGGGAIDAVRFMKGGEFSHRTAYATVMLPTTMAIGAAVTYLITGHGPKDILDYFFPPTGRTLSDGREERVALPGYDKDLAEYNSHPLTTVANKMSPMISMLLQLRDNSDYADNNIYMPPALGRALGMSNSQIGETIGKDLFLFFLSQYLPIGQLGQTMKKSLGLPQQKQKTTEATPTWLQLLFDAGISPAPASIVAPEAGENWELIHALKGYKKKLRSSAQ